MVKITVEGLPEGVSPGAILFVKPKTIEEFDAIVELAGGPGEFDGGERNGFASAVVDGGSLFLYVPTDIEGEAPKPESPGKRFMREFEERRAAAAG